MSEYPRDDEHYGASWNRERPPSGDPEAPFYDRHDGTPAQWVDADGTPNPGSGTLPPIYRAYSASPLPQTRRGHRRRRGGLLVALGMVLGLLLLKPLLVLSAILATLVVGAVIIGVLVIFAVLALTAFTRTLAGGRRVRYPRW